MVKNNVAGAFSIIAAVTSLGIAAPALAQGSSAQGAKIDNVIVNARRTEESMQAVPISITAVSAEQLQERQVTTGTDLQKLVPTLSVTTSIFGASQQYSLRGVRTGVLTYFNDVTIPTSVVDLQLWDIGSIQAIAGPQGTLFGRNSTGGAVLFVPNKPTREFGGYLQAGVGNYNQRELTAVINTPVNDMLQFRFGARVVNRDGVTENISGPDKAAQERQSFRVSGLFEPSENFNNHLVVSYSKRDETPFAQISESAGVGPCPATFLSCIYPSYLTQLNEQQQRGVRKIDSPYPAVLFDEAWQLSNTAEIKLGAMTLKSITGYMSERSRQFHSLLSIPLPIIRGQNLDKLSTFSEEIQLLGNAFDDRLQWVSGLYYLHQRDENDAAYQLFVPAGTVFDTHRATANGGVNRLTSSAIYAQGTYSITPRWKLTAGLRRTKDKSALHSYAVNPGDTCALPNLSSVDLAACTQDLDAIFHATTYTASVDYQATDDILFYATTRKGYNAGGFNAIVADPSLVTIKPEYIQDYEVGMKADWRIGSMPVRSNLSAFRAKYKDIQRTTSVILDGRPITGNFNAAEATIYGGQIELVARPTSQLDVSASYGYLNTKYDSFQNALVGDATGNKFAQAPSKTFNTSVTYTQPMPSGEIVANVSYSYLSTVFFDDANLGGPGDSQQAYGLVDARLDWKDIFTSGLTIGAYVKNATDKTYALYAQDQADIFGFVARTYGDPRVYGVQVKYEY